MLMVYTKFNSKWSKDPNTRHEILKLLEENQGSNLPDADPDTDFYVMNKEYILQQYAQT